LVVAEFDQIAEVYDETRRPLATETVEGMKEMFSKHECHSILEIGVGTGRVSLPLKNSGFEMTGVDISIKMMEKARGKGLENLILASGNQTPFKDEIYDATIMAHVFHLLDDPVSVLREASRVSHIAVFALVRKGAWGGRWQGYLYGMPRGGQAVGGGEMDEATRKYLEERREHFRAIAEKYGWKPDLARERHWEREQEILTTYPPDDVKVVSDALVTDSIEERISRLERGAFSSMSSMPEAMRQELAQEMRANAAKFPERILQPRHEVYQLAMWRPEKFLRKSSTGN
jgi:ubiquinone/menaquinone biosynthesis C-methylase UbiE